MSQTNKGKLHFRRHFIIVKDISAPFLNQLANSDALQKTIVGFFTNPSVQLPPEANAINLYEERTSGFKAFDPDKDEISFFHFGIAKSEFENLQKVDKFNNTPSGKLSAFTSCFLKDKHFTWSQKKQSNLSITQYLSEALKIEPNPNEFGLGVSLSNYVYPLILDELATANSYASDYILVTLSDFLTGAKLGNTDDFMRIEEIYHSSSTNSNGTPSLIKKNTEKLKSQFYTLDYFDVPFTGGKKTIAAYFTFIKPIAGGTGSNEYSLNIEGNQGIRQQGFKSDEFITNPTKLKFSHNSRLKIQGVRLKIALHDKVIFDTLIASRDNNNHNLWHSNFVLNNAETLMQYDSIKKTYALPSFTVTLPILSDASEKNDVTLTYSLDCIYTADGSKPGYIYETSTALSGNQVQYSNPPNKVIMNTILTIVAPIAAALILLAWLIKRGRPTDIRIIPNGYTDTFEQTDYDKKGKVVAPYKYWHEANDMLNCEATFTYKSPNYLFNWKPKLKLIVMGQGLPKGFDICLKADNDAIEQHYTNNPLVISHNGKGEVNPFTLLISKTGPDYTPPEPEMLNITISAWSSKSLLLGLFGCNLQQELNYSFYAGPDLGKVWVSFDPGTSGSCIAAGLNADDIILEHTKYGEELITDSKVVIDLSEPGYSKQSHNERLPAKFYKYGQDASAVFGNKKRASYQSIKKLLGFTDKRTEKFDSKDDWDNEFEISGKKISSLLVQGIYTSFSKYLIEANTKQTRELLQQGQFKPLRAVVAIPNNFTAAKIKEMLECIGYLGQFKEIRYIYEAEAVLFYYLRNYKILAKSNAIFSKESILVFDMGGATINASVFNGEGIPKDNTTNYTIDTLAKLGYGIGGDTIDYCILQSIFLYAEDIPVINAIKIEFEKVINRKYVTKEEIDSRVKALQAMSMRIKLKIIANIDDNGTVNLISVYDLESAIQAAANNMGYKVTEIDNIDPDSDFYKIFSKENTNAATYILNNSYFCSLIYDNITTIINDLLQLSSGTVIDTAILSGRSTLFPLIKKTVIDVLKKKGNKPNEVVLNLVEAKTVVAKGACWYGVSKDAVTLTNIKTNASFGVKHRTGAEDESIEYIELVPALSKFNDNEAGIRFLQKAHNTMSDFSKDNQLVNFYQVMGSNPDTIIRENQLHKLSKIAAIAIDKTTKKTELRVNENDSVQCAVQLNNGKVLLSAGSVADQEITDANAEHYTWIVQ